MAVQSISGNNYSNPSLSSPNARKEEREVKNQRNGTEIKLENNFEGTFKKARKILDIYYEKMTAENKSFPNPERHVDDKYWNRTSSYFRSDMTEAERHIAWRNEIRMLKEGKTCSCNLNDYALRGFDPLYANVMEEDKAKDAFNRSKITEQFNQLLKENNITIPKDKSLTFTINPYDYSVTVEGLEDPALEERLRELLGRGDNSKNLYHNMCRYANKNQTSQYTKEKQDKCSLFWDVKSTTGYDLRNLKSIDGKFYTEDGRDIAELYKYSSAIPSAYRQGALEYLLPRLKHYAEAGFESGEDLFMSFDYLNGELIDKK